MSATHTRSIRPSVALAVLLLAWPARAESPTPPVTPGGVPVLASGVPSAGSFGPGDFPLETIVSEEAGDTTWTDIYTWYGMAGQSVRIAVSASVPVYLALLDPAGRRLASGGAEGDDAAPWLEATLETTGPHTVVVNSFHGDPGTYTVTATGGAVTSQPGPPPGPGPTPELGPVPTPTPGPVPSLLTLGTVLPGTFSEGDAPLESLLSGNDGDRTWSDAYRLDAESGRGLRVEVDATVPIYVALADSSGELLRGDGTQGDQTHTRILYVPSEDDPLLLVVNSYNGDPGSYTLSVQPATREDLAELSDDLPVDGVLTPGTPVRDAIEPADRIYRTYVVDVPQGVTTLTITTESAQNIDLFVRYGVQILANWNTEPDFSGTSEGGDEVVRVSTVSEPPLQSGRYYIDVVAFVATDDQSAAAPVPFTLSAQVTQTVVPIIVNPVPINTEGMVTGTFAAQLVPGRRVSARIEPSISPLQVWSVQVPPGARRLEIRTFDATGRLDLVVAPPGTNLANSIEGLLSMPYRAITARDDERLVIDGASRPPLSPGAYTVAVLDLYSEVASDYAIAVGLDEPLATDSAFVPPTAEELAALGPMQRAVRATVQLTLSLEEGGLEFGSGTILTSDGLILTDHHVVGGCEHTSPYLLGCVGDVYRQPGGTPIEVYVGLSNEHEASAEQHFIAEVVRSLPAYDLALLQIVSDLDGNPLDVALPTLPVDVSPEAVWLGEPVAVIGYPGVAGLGSRISLSMTRGFVTGFTDDRGQRVFVNVDANIAGGNSGGALVDESGVLVGVPSNQNLIRERGERQDFARTLTLLPAEWLDLLRAHGAQLQ